MDMDFESAVRDQMALLMQGEPLEAFDTYFDDDGVMYDNDELFGTGKVECRAKQAVFIEKAQDIIGNVTHCSVDLEQNVCVFRNQNTFVTDEGEAGQTDGIHWQRWHNGKIVEERYYQGDMMAQRASEGMLDLKGPDVETLTPRDSAQATALREAVTDALTELVKTEQVDMAANAMWLVAEELTLAGLEAHNARHALKKLRKALIHSEHVEEVYADDLHLEAAFRKAMGG